ncbi:MAG: alpha/beta hydrolase [Cyclobacteriaceae bacterium]
MAVNSNSYYQTYINTGEGQVVILLHGIFGNVHIWKSVVEALRPSYRVVIPRIPLSDLPLEDANVKHIAHVLHEFVEHHELKNVILVGHAVGGQLALMYTHLYPSNVKKLVLVGSAGLMERAPLPGSEPLDLQILQDEFEHAYYFKGHLLDKVAEDLCEVADDTSKHAAIEKIARSSRQYEVSTFLGKIDHPVLLVWGLHDPVSPPESALHFNDLLSNSEIRFIENCGHVPMVEKPDQFVTHLLSFLKPSSGSAWHSKKH